MPARLLHIAILVPRWLRAAPSLIQKVATLQPPPPFRLCQEKTTPKLFNIMRHYGNIQPRRNTLSHNSIILNSRTALARHRTLFYPTTLLAVQGLCLAFCLYLRHLPSPSLHYTLVLHCIPPPRFHSVHTQSIASAPHASKAPIQHSTCYVLVARPLAFSSPIRHSMPCDVFPHKRALAPLPTLENPNIANPHLKFKNRQVPISKNKK